MAVAGRTRTGSPVGPFHHAQRTAAGLEVGVGPLHQRKDHRQQVAAHRRQDVLLPETGARFAVRPLPECADLHELLQPGRGDAFADARARHDHTPIRLAQVLEAEPGGFVAPDLGARPDRS
ncbi:hypothetical protein GA0115240_10778 [Streptomyces sp. DvalAA-14]|nr:hypothetical protein GA0115240_10778 [Streptomyces sp. DvalAA-14]